MELGWNRLVGPRPRAGAGGARTASQPPASRPDAVRRRPGRGQASSTALERWASRASAPRLSAEWITQRKPTASEWSGSATWACPWRSRSPRRAARGRPRFRLPARRRRSTRGTSHVEDVPSRRPGRGGRGRPADARPPTTTSSRGADAIVICVPTPLTENRQPDLGPLVDAAHLAVARAAQGPAGGARVDDVPGHDPRAARAAARGVRARRRPRLPRGVLSGAGRPGPLRLHAAQHREGRRRRDRRVRRRPRARCTSASATRCWSSPAPEAAELSKLLENIFRSVNIALVNELAVLCDRMGIDIWEVIDAAATKPFGFMRFDPGPGHGRPLPAGRPVLPGLEGARVRLLHRVHRARREDQPEHALLLRGQDRAHAELARQAGATARASCCWASSYKPGVGDTAPVAGAEDPEAARRARRATSPTTTRTSRRCRRRACSRRRSTRRSSGADLVVIVTAHPEVDYRRVVAESRAGARLPRRHARDRVGQPGAPVSWRPRRVTVGVVGLGYWGPNLARNFAALDGCELRWCCDALGGARQRWRARSRHARSPPTSATCWRTRSSTRSCSRPTCRRTRGSRPRSLRGRQALLRREAACAVGGGGGRRSSTRPAAADRVLMVGHLLEYHPGVAKLKEIVDSGELGDVRYVYSNRLNLGQDPRGRERALEPRRARRLGAPAPVRREEPVEALAHGESFVRDGVEDVVFCYLRFPSGPRRAHAPLVARPAQGAALHRRRARTAWRPSTTWRWSGR